MAVEGRHGGRAQQLAARHGNAHLQGLNHGRRCAVDGREGAHRRRHRVLHGVEAQRHLGDDAEGAFGADEQPRQVVARRRFLRAARGLDQAPVGQHHFQREHVFAHRAVAHCIRARGARRRHAADRRVGAWIDGEEKPGVLYVLVQLLARHAGLHHRIEVLAVHGEYLVHVREIDRNAALYGEDVTLERGTDAEGNHWHAVAAADVDDVAHFFRAVWKDDGVGQRVRKI